MSVLFVDDDADIIETYEMYAESKDLAFNKALNGVEAWELLQTRSYDLVITDLRMPQMDGIELIKKIKTEMKDDIPTVVVVTGDAELLHTMKKTFDSIVAISKPFSPEDLDELLESVGLA